MTPINKIGTWLLYGETGASSIALAAVYLGADARELPCPSDPSDFRRCMNFLRDCIPEEKHKGLVKTLGTLQKKSVPGGWRAVSINLSKLIELYEDEKDQQEAPKLYSFMKEIGL